MSLDLQHSAFLRNRFLAMPIAGTIMWAAIGIAGAVLPREQAAWAVFIGTGMIFYVGLIVARITGEDLLGKKKQSPFFDQVFFMAIVMAVLVYAIAIPFFFADPTSLPLSVGILAGLMWLPFSAMVGHWVGYFHAFTRTILVLLAWYLVPDHRFVAIPAVIVAVYLVTIYALEKRYRSVHMLLTRPAIVVLLFVAPLAFVSAQQPEGFPPNDPDSWRLAGTAKVFCSALFVSGRDSAEARGHIAAYFLGPKVDSINAIHIDRRRKLVRMTLANRVTREAKQYGDQGCVIHQPGKDTVFFKPVRVTTALPDASTLPWPMGDVLPTTPLPAEIDTAKLRQAVDSAFANPAGLTAAFVVVHKGRIIAEKYANSAHKDMQLESWSMGKSITGTLVGRLIQQGALRLDDPAPVPNWRKTPDDARAKIRVMDLMRMSSGLRFSRGSPEDLPGYHDHDLIYTGALDAFEFVTTRPLQFEPNTFGRYRNTDPLTLGLIIRDAVRKRGEEYLTWPQRALFDKIGIRRQVLETDPYGNFLLSGYDYGTGRNWARIGMLYLNDGVWNGERLLPEGFVKFVATPAPAWRDSSYGGMVWVNGRGTWPVPRDAFAFRGAGGQETYVIPSRQLVVVRMGHFPGSRIGGANLQRGLAVLMEAIPEVKRASTERSKDCGISSGDWSATRMGSLRIGMPADSVKLLCSVVSDTDVREYSARRMLVVEGTDTMDVWVEGKTVAWIESRSATALNALAPRISLDRWLSLPGIKIGYGDGDDLLYVYADTGDVCGMRIQLDANTAKSLVKFRDRSLHVPVRALRPFTSTARVVGIAVLGRRGCRG